MIVFLDACALIYRVEEVTPWNGRLSNLLAGIRRRHPDAELAISRLSCLECRVQPLRDRDTPLLEGYAALFAAADLRIVEIGADVIEGATRIRAQFGLRTPDAIQAASCLSLQADHVFVTSDRSFARVPGLSTAPL